MFSRYDFVASFHVPAIPPAGGISVAARFHCGERSEPQWNRAATTWKGTGQPRGSSSSPLLPALGCCPPPGFLLFLRKQENEAAALLQRAVGGVRELVQPSDDFAQSEAQPEPR